MIRRTGICLLNWAMQGATYILLEAVDLEFLMPGQLPAQARIMRIQRTLRRMLYGTIPLVRASARTMLFK